MLRFELGQGSKVTLDAVDRDACVGPVILVLLWRQGYRSVSARTLRRGRRSPGKHTLSVPSSFTLPGTVAERRSLLANIVWNFSKEAPAYLANA